MYFKSKKLVHYKNGGNIQITIVVKLIEISENKLNHSNKKYFTNILTFHYVKKLCLSWYKIMYDIVKSKEFDN